jgi:3-hydroxyacyl-CoA dehydrogenase
MPLVEVGTTKHSSPVAVATAVAVAQSCGKTPVLVKDSPGLLVNRVLFPQLHAALKLAESGQSIPAMDKAIRNWGMPMGSFELMDEIGLDVTLFILNALTRELGDRFTPPTFLETLVKDGHVGNKAGKGFYVRSKERGAPPPLNDAAMKLLPPPAATQLSEEMIQNQLMLPMAREAKMTLDEGIVDSIDTIDIATLLGLGFAQFRGGLGTWMQSLDDGPH